MTKSLIITSTNKQERNDVARAVIQTRPAKYTVRLSPRITDSILATMRELRYLDLILIEDTKDEKEILELKRRIEQYTDATVIFTSDSPCYNLSTDTRFKIITIHDNTRAIKQIC